MKSTLNKEIPSNLLENGNISISKLLEKFFSDNQKPLKQNFQSNQILKKLEKYRQS